MLDSQVGLGRDVSEEMRHVGERRSSWAEATSHEINTQARHIAESFGYSRRDYCGVEWYDSLTEDLLADEVVNSACQNPNSAPGPSNEAGIPECRKWMLRHDLDAAGMLGMGILISFSCFLTASLMVVSSAAKPGYSSLMFLMRELRFRTAKEWPGFIDLAISSMTEESVLQSGCCLPSHLGFHKLKQILRDLEATYDISMVPSRDTGL